MKYFSITDVITIDTLEKLEDFINSLTNEPITINICSEGGELEAGLGIMDIINNYPGEVILQAIGGICSCALHIFLFSNTRKYVMPMCYGMHHMCDFDMSYKKYITNDTLSKIMVEQGNQWNEAYATMLKSLKVDKNLIKKFKAGEDVYIDTKELEREAEAAEAMLYTPKEVVQTKE